MKIKHLKYYLSYLFINGNGFFSYLTNIGKVYEELKFKEISVVDNRKTNFTPIHKESIRINNYFNDKTHEILDFRVK